MFEEGVRDAGEQGEGNQDAVQDTAASQPPISDVDMTGTSEQGDEAGEAGGRWGQFAPLYRRNG